MGGMAIDSISTARETGAGDDERLVAAEEAKEGTDDEVVEQEVFERLRREPSNFDFKVEALKAARRRM